MAMQNAIELRDISKHYSNFTMHQLNLNLETGRIMGLVGVNGAGKSTTIRMIMGMIQPDAGSVSVLGKCLPDEQIDAKYDIGYASEDIRLYKSQTLAWHMAFVASIFTSWDQRYADHLLDKFDLQKTQKLKGFSHGQRVKACLLLQLARRPKLMILDEPTTGLDPVARAEIIDELAAILRDEKRSVLFSSHNTKDIEQLADRLCFIHQGKLIADQDTDTFIDTWRTLRCTSQSSKQPSLSAPAYVKRSGNLWEVSLSDAIDKSAAELAQQGFEVVDNNRMSLEEIFVATVRREKTHAN